MVAGSRWTGACAAESQWAFGDGPLVNLTCTSSSQLPAYPFQIGFELQMKVQISGHFLTTLCGPWFNAGFWKLDVEGSEWLARNMSFNVRPNRSIAWRYKKLVIMIERGGHCLRSFTPFSNLNLKTSNSLHLTVLSWMTSTRCNWRAVGWYSPRKKTNAIRPLCD